MKLFFFFRLRCVYGKSLRFGITPDLRRLLFFLTWLRKPWNGGFSVRTC
nr:MAG TPA: hypothetical protein [Caudoviricetes sp.]